MTHRRKQIRDTVVATLTSAVSAVDSRVFSNRTLPLHDDTQLPALNVYAADEAEELHEVSTTSCFRNLSLVVEIIAKVADNVTIDDALDALAETVEAAMVADYTAGGYAIDSQLSATTIAADADGQYTVGRMRLTYTVRYRF